ncbi:hypothetical protein VTO42DRAFT_1025 [Malbranchea cinnamomea]
MPQGQGTPVEARSLLSLTNLAANPPAYPRNPTQKPLEPLVLYIVRVPGSKDVFLSPLKPPTKSSVTPEALNASLYFLHVAGPEDEALLESIEQERRFYEQKRQSGEIEDGGRNAEKNSKFALLNRVRRKPVPGIGGDTGNVSQSATGASAPVEERHGESLRPPPPLPPRPSWQQIHVDGKQVDSDVLRDQGRDVAPGDRLTREFPSQAPILPPRPLPPLPTENRNSSFQSHARGHAGRWSVLTETTSQSSSPVRPPRPIIDQGRAARASWDGGRRPLFRPGSSGNLRAGNHLAFHPKDVKEFLRPRKDYNGPQEPRSIAEPFYITLIRRDPTHGNQWNVGTITNASNTSPSEVSVDGAITVEITTPGYKRFVGANSAHVSLESLGITSLSEPRSSVPTLQRPHSASSRSTNFWSPLKFERKVQLSNPTYHRSHHRHHSHDVSHTGHYSRSSKGFYTFISPWNGICTFTTGGNGRSLKCRHFIPGPTTASTTNSSEASAAVTVAEIRFNLPLFGLGISAPTQGNQKSSGGGSLFPPDPDRLDLSLARERAGGGMRGNSAKLGKLIIENEGLKMLDLVVAACMGVWWKVYEQVQC